MKIVEVGRHSVTAGSENCDGSNKGRRDKALDLPMLILLAKFQKPTLVLTLD